MAIFILCIVGRYCKNEAKIFTLFKKWLRIEGCTWHTWTVNEDFYVLQLFRFI